MKKLCKFEAPNRVYKVVTMGEFFGLVSAFFGWLFSGVGAIVAALAAIPLLLLLSPLISFIFFCFFAHGLLRKRNLSKYSKEMQESLSEYYRKKEEKRRSEVPVTVVLTILFLVLTIGCTLGVILYFQSN